MKDWLINLFGYVCAFLIIVKVVHTPVTVYYRVKSIVMFFINIPLNTRVFIADAKKRLAPDNKVATSKTSRDDVSDPAPAAIQHRGHKDC
jgi:hypothetical protein